MRRKQGSRIFGLEDLKEDIKVGIAKKSSGTYSRLREGMRTHQRGFGLADSPRHSNETSSSNRGTIEGTHQEHEI